MFKYKIGLICCFLIALISGCEKSPDTIEINGIKKAENQIEQNVKNDIKPTSSLKADSYVAETYTKGSEVLIDNINKSIHKSISIGDFIVDVNGEFENINYQECISGVLHENINENAIVEFLLGEDSNTAKYDSYTGAYNIREEIILQFAGDVSYVNFPLYTEYDSALSIELNQVSETDFQLVDAQEKLYDLMHQFGFSEQNMTFNVTASASKSQGIYYRFALIPRINENLFASPEEVDFGLAASLPYGRVVLGADGFAEVTLSSFFCTEITDEKEVVILTGDEVVDVITMMLGTQIQVQADMLVDNFSVKYLILDSVVTPVWRFDWSVKGEPYGQPMYINAVTGSRL